MRLWRRWGPGDGEVPSGDSLQLDGGGGGGTGLSPLSKAGKWKKVVGFSLKGEKTAAVALNPVTSMAIWRPKVDARYREQSGGGACALEGGESTGKHDHGSDQWYLMGCHSR
jgi:hypothetical protein